jgi:hypothetical protein
MIKNILLSVSLFFAIFVASAQINEQYVVSALTANLRVGQGTEEPLIATLSKNDIVRVLKANKDQWWRVDFNGTQGFMIATLLKKRPLEGWIPTKYVSGDTPQCENEKPEFDLNLDNHLKVTVNSKSDVVLKLMRKESGGDRCVRTTYIESDDFVLIKNIPEGKYYLKLAYGTDWRQKKIAGKCEGRFTMNAQYEIGQQHLNFKIIQLSSRIDIPSYALTLGNQAKKGIDVTFNANLISEAEFNN